ncbi:exodeoxyribonuclease VII large subunit [Dysgonomonadaceae bacterium PH5-43]|nr:exodeoxyribonuclease VII large subunit [Dysgonomonadaceae bacterium PH5-43]
MKHITLSQLNQLVSNEVKNAFPDTYWIIAETSDVRQNSNGHCYLELIEKNSKTNTTTAKARAYIWSSIFALLKPGFEQKTGQCFSSGLKVLVKVSIDFHPLYGYGLNILDIDPNYTVGDMQQKRQEIISQLKEDGVFTLNKELSLPTPPKRIAIISSPTAAGYEDFINQLSNNKQGFVFYTHLFPAIMQGDKTEASVISALNKIYNHQDKFDVVIIIRGGGASSDLASFDSYELAVNCAQFPLPIITGIGHERDDTVLDLIAYYRAKTPTAVAEYLINILNESYNRLLNCQSNIIELVNRRMYDEKKHLNDYIQYIPVFSNMLIERNKNELKSIESFLKLSSPSYILKKGFSITLKDGKAVKSAKDIKEGDVIETIYYEGKTTSTVK